MKYRYITVSAAPGEPSVYWKSVSGKYYRTLSEAKKDSGLNTLPDPTIAGTGIEKNIISILIFAAVIFSVYKLIKK